MFSILKLIFCKFFKNIFCVANVPFHSERDRFERDGLDINRQFTTLEASHQNVIKERDELSREVCEFILCKHL